MENARHHDSLLEELRALRLEVAELHASAPSFGLVWPRTPDPLLAEIHSHGTTLTIDDAKTIGSPSEAPHLLVKGDNLVGLYAVRDSHRGTVDTCYIDPPYNTGNTNRTGFTYSDRFRTPADEERHSSWLSMMSARLEVARELLKPTGVILVSIDDNEVHHLRLLCDLVFGEHNFVAQMVWDGGTVKNNARLISGTHEYVLVYARSLAALYEAGVVWREPRPGVELLVQRYEQAKAIHKDDYEAIGRVLKKWVKTANISKRLKVFTGVDGRGLFTYADLSAPGGAGARYNVLHPTTGKPCQVPSRGWGYTEARMRELNDDNRLLFGPDEMSQPMRKLYLAEKLDQVRRSILDYPARSSTHLIEHMLGRRNAFNNPKNLDMLTDLIRLVAPKDAVVMDFFAGSGTTGHAVLRLNAEDGGTRQFILMTNNENNIFDKVTYPRLQAAISGEWANKRREAPLGGALVCLTASVTSLGGGRLPIEQLRAMVFLYSDTMPTTNSHTASALGRRAAFAWDGLGRKSDARRALARFSERVPEDVGIVLIGQASELSAANSVAS